MNDARNYPQFRDEMQVAIMHGALSDAPLGCSRNPFGCVYRHSRLADHAHDEQDMAELMDGRK